VASYTHGLFTGTGFDEVVTLVLENRFKCKQTGRLIADEEDVYLTLSMEGRRILAAERSHLHGR
jgi:hypothetical protein